jgi:putative toxin-antitoxin system antitoxin component (TIGR02293 family)
LKLSDGGRWLKSFPCHFAIRQDDNAMSTAVSRKIDSIKKNANISASNIAQLVGTSPQTLSRWTTGKNDPQLEHLERLLALDYVAEQLVEFFEPDDVKLWLLAPHPQLGGERPADLLAEGRLEEVRAVIERLRDSAYV